MHTLHTGAHTHTYVRTCTRNTRTHCAGYLTIPRTTLHYDTLHYIAVGYTTVHYVTLRYITFTYIHTYKHKLILAYIHVYTHTCIYAHLHTQTCTHADTPTHTDTHTHTSIHPYTCTWTLKPAPTYLSGYVPLYDLHIYMPYTRIYPYRHNHMFVFLDIYTAI